MHLKAMQRINNETGVIRYTIAGRVSPTQDWHLVGLADEFTGTSEPLVFITRTAREAYMSAIADRHSPEPKTWLFTFADGQERSYVATSYVKVLNILEETLPPDIGAFHLREVSYDSDSVAPEILRNFMAPKGAVK